MSDLLAPLKDRFLTYLRIPEDDTLAVDYVYSLALAGIITSMKDKPWGFFCGPSGCAKTEIMRACHDHPDILFRDELTSNSFISGDHREVDAAADPNQIDDDPSIARQVNNRTLMVKDFSLMRQKDREALSSLIGTSRGGHDGFLDKQSGKAGVGHRGYVTYFGMLLASTPLPDSLARSLQQEGARYLSFYMARAKWAYTLRHEVICTAMYTGPEREATRLELQALAYEMINLAKEGAEEKFMAFRRLPAIVEPIADIADLVCRTRTLPVKTSDPYGEIGTRVGQQLINLGIAHLILQGRDRWNASDFDLLLRSGYDSIPTSLLAILVAIISCTLQKPGGHCPTSDEIARTIQAHPAYVHNVTQQFSNSDLIQEAHRGSQTFRPHPITLAQLQRAPLLSHSPSPKIQDLQKRILDLSL